MINNQKFWTIMSMVVLISTLLNASAIASSTRLEIAVGDVFQLNYSDKLYECQSVWLSEFSTVENMPATGTLSTDAIVWRCDDWGYITKGNADSLCATIAANSGHIAQLTPITRRYAWFFEQFVDWGCEVTGVR